MRNILYQQLFPEEINIACFPEQYNGILRVMQRDGNMTPLQVYFDRGRLFASFGNELIYNDLMLRSYVKWVEIDGKVHTQLVLARIMFIHVHCGYMDKLEKAMIQHVSKESELDQIMIESVIQEDMRNWCISHGYTEQTVYHGQYYKILKHRQT